MNLHNPHPNTRLKTPLKGPHCLQNLSSGKGRHALLRMWSPLHLFGFIVCCVHLEAICSRYRPFPFDAPPHPILPMALNIPFSHQAPLWLPPHPGKSSCTFSGEPGYNVPPTRLPISTANHLGLRHLSPPLHPLAGCPSITLLSNSLCVCYCF